MLSNRWWMIAFGSAIFIVNDVHDTKNGSRKDKPSNKESNNGSGDSHYYLFIPYMAFEPLIDFFHTLNWWSHRESNPDFFVANEMSYR